MGSAVKQLRTLRLVLVDDDAARTRLWSSLFEADGHTVLPCHDLSSACRAIAEGCDCLITALHVRDFSGLDLIRAANHPAGPVMVLLTSDDSAQLRANALAAGATYIFEEGVEPARLVSTVEALCGAIYQPVTRYATGEIPTQTLRSAL